MVYRIDSTSLLSQSDDGFVPLISNYHIALWILLFSYSFTCYGLFKFSLLPHLIDTILDGHSRQQRVKTLFDLWSIRCTCSVLTQPLLTHLSDLYGRKAIFSVNAFGMVLFSGFVMLSSLKDDIQYLYYALISLGLFDSFFTLGYATISDFSVRTDFIKNFGGFGCLFGFSILAGAYSWMFFRHLTYFWVFVTLCLFWGFMMCILWLIEEPQNYFNYGNPNESFSIWKCIPLYGIFKSCEKHPFHYLNPMFFGYSFAVETLSGSFRHFMLHHKHSYESIVGFLTGFVILESLVQSRIQGFEQLWGTANLVQCGLLFMMLGFPLLYGHYVDALVGVGLSIIAFGYGLLQPTLWAVNCMWTPRKDVANSFGVFRNIWLISEIISQQFTVRFLDYVKEQVVGKDVPGLMWLVCGFVVAICNIPAILLGKSIIPRLYHAKDINLDLLEDHPNRHENFLLLKELDQIPNNKKRIGVIGIGTKRDFLRQAQSEFSNRCICVDVMKLDESFRNLYYKQRDTFHQKGLLKLYERQIDQQKDILITVNCTAPTPERKFVTIMGQFDFQFFTHIILLDYSDSILSPSFLTKNSVTQTDVASWRRYEISHTTQLRATFASSTPFIIVDETTNLIELVQSLLDG